MGRDNAFNMRMTVKPHALSAMHFTMLVTKLQYKGRQVQWYFSKEKKILDYYCERIRKLYKLTDSEVARFKELAQKEKELYSSD